ncbi:polysaccharide pyruvyl transferase family protein [Bacillus cereus]|nr:polysaccharide pyruvyl transferase family protein [Bacillus cereus]
MNSVFLSGYYGEKNTGDDALLNCALWGCYSFLKPDSINVTTFPFTHNEFSFNSIFSKEESVRNKNLINLYYYAITAQYIVFGGGSVFHSTDKMTQNIDLMDLCRSDKAIALGVSFGPFRDSGAETACKKLLERFKYIGCRDSASFQLVQSLAPHVKVEKTFDLAPLLFRALGEKNTYLNNRNRKGLGLALCHYEQYINGDISIEKRRIKKIINVLNQLSSYDIEEIILIDFNGHPIFGDSNIHKEIIQNLKVSIPIKHVPYHQDPLNALKKIANLKCLIGMRLHSSIFGYITNTPTIIFSYHPKCIGWAEQVKASKDFIINSQQFEEEELLTCINNIFNSGYKNPKLSIEQAEKLALRNWEGAKWTLCQ